MPSNGHDADGGIIASGCWRCTVSSKTPKLCSSAGSRKISTPGLKFRSEIQVWNWPNQHPENIHLSWKEKIWFLMPDKSYGTPLGLPVCISFFKYSYFIDFCRSTSVAKPVALTRGLGMSFSNMSVKQRAYFSSIKKYVDWKKFSCSFELHTQQEMQ